ncbi:MAG: hypothetical protein RMK94_12790 [Armatimonadota bacterium]|nr:hypothetical protein [Armatimonadota bacterium]
MDAGAKPVRPRGRPRKAYLRWKAQLTLDLQRDREVIEALFERIPRGKRAAFIREALREAVGRGLVEEFLRFRKRYHGDIMKEADVS